MFDCLDWSVIVVVIAVVVVVVVVIVVFVAVIVVVVVVVLWQIASVVDKSLFSSSNNQFIEVSQNSAEIKR